MKVAIPTDDRQTAAKRSGQAKEFAIYEIIDSKITNVEYFENHHKHHDEEEHTNNHEHAHAEIVEIIKDVDLLVMTKVGKHLKADIVAADISYKIAKENNIDKIIEEFM